MEQLTAEEWKSKFEASKDGVMIDVRTPGECAEGIILGALQQDIHAQQEFIDFLETLDKEKPYFMYCRSGARSGNACSYMESIGFKETYNLVGGFMDWPY